MKLAVQNIHFGRQILCKGFNKIKMEKSRASKKALLAANQLLFEKMKIYYDLQKNKNSSFSNDYFFLKYTFVDTFLSKFSGYRMLALFRPYF